MLQIEDLQVRLGDKEILKHIDLEILPGETHILYCNIHGRWIGDPVRVIIS